MRSPQTNRAAFLPRRPNSSVAAVTVVLAFALLPLTQRSAHAQCALTGCTVQSFPVMKCNANWFPLLCRGFLPTSDYFFAANAGGTLSPFSPNGSAAGGNGSTLSPGTCAWTDRALRSNEPHLLLKPYTSTVSGDNFSSPVDAATNTLVQCSMNHSCVFAVCAINTTELGTQVLEAATPLVNNGVAIPSADILTLFPTFPKERRTDDDDEHH
jgi:hypothetical protein